MRSYNFTPQRKKIYRLYAGGMDLRDIAREIKVSATRIDQIVKKIQENVPKTELDKIKIQVAR
jgi:DNA-binding NarL/FixJ family response regulator